MYELLEVFATVVEQASLNRASKVLNISQPALSRKMTALEELLGVKLFDRKGKKLELTRIGQIAYEHAMEVRQIKRRFMQTISNYKGDEKKSILIGASLTTLQMTLPDLITAFTHAEPHIDIKAITGKTHEIVTLVKQRKVDVGLVASTIDDLSLNCIPLFDDHLCLVLPAQHELSNKKNIDIHDLHKLNMILFSKGTWYRILMDELFHRYAAFPEITMEIDSFEAIIRLVSTCDAATLLPKSYLRSNLLEDNQLIIIQIPELEHTARTTSLIYAEKANLSEATESFIKQTKRIFAYEA